MSARNKIDPNTRIALSEKDDIKQIKTNFHMKSIIRGDFSNLIKKNLDIKSSDIINKHFINERCESLKERLVPENKLVPVANDNYEYRPRRSSC